ncbi:MAG: ferric reductase-like transmembrane domain-containing protein [Acidimicrobiales bacterium]
MTEVHTLPRRESTTFEMRRRPTRSPRRTARAPKPRVASTLALIAGVGFGLSIGLAFWGQSFSSYESAGGWFTLAGRVTGLTGTYLMLIMVLLVTRLPWLEETVGQVRLVKWHRTVGGWPIVLIALHVVFITIGYAQASHVGALAEFWTFIVHYPDMLTATVAFLLLVMAGVSSLPVVRRKMKYQTWWAVHLYLYLALILAFAHEIKIGVMFIGHPITLDSWIALSAGTLGAVLGYRIVRPLVRNLRLQLRVVDVREEAPGVYSIIITGRNVGRLQVSGGQFFQWRFMARGLWWHSHPYSLSALPRPPYIRVTIKRLGLQSLAATRLKPGTRVFVEGPYGVFTPHVRRSEKVVLIGAGVGISPIRALLEDLPATTKVTVILRASSVEDLVHRDEMIDLVHARGGQLHEIVGSRQNVRLDAPVLRKLISNVRNSDVYVCGPSGFSDGITDALLQLGVNRDRIHHEAFAF